MLRKLFWLLGLFLIYQNSVLRAQTGNMAFIAVNTDSLKDLALVVLQDFPPDTLFITDDEWNGTGFNGSEGILTWIFTDTLRAGKVIVFSEISSESNPGFSVSEGTITRNGSFNPSGANECLYVYKAPLAGSGSEIFITAWSNESFDDGSTVGSLTNSGLEEGKTAINIDFDEDVAVFKGFRYAIDKEKLQLHLYDVNQWETSDGSGNQSTSFLPFDTTKFHYSGAMTLDGEKGWRLFGIPSNQSTLQELQDDFYMQLTSDVDSASIYTYDQQGLYKPVARATDIIESGLGIAAYIFDNEIGSGSVLPFTIDTDRVEVDTDVMVSLNTTNSYPDASGSFFTLLANPFHTPYKLSSLLTDQGDIQQHVAMWNSGANSYDYVDINNTIIPPWQAFWVERSNTSVATSITFPNSGRTNDQNTTSTFKDGIDYAYITFTLLSEDNPGLLATSKVLFHSNADTTFDIYDAQLLSPISIEKEIIELSFLGNEGKRKSIESIPFRTDKKDQLTLSIVTSGVEGMFTISWKGVENVPPPGSLFLLDPVNNRKIDLRKSNSYSFRIDNSISQYTSIDPMNLLLRNNFKTHGPLVKNREGNRVVQKKLKFIISEREERNIENNILKITNYPNPFNHRTNFIIEGSRQGPIELNIYTVSGQKVYTESYKKNNENLEMSWEAIGYPSGIYIYQIIAQGRVSHGKVTLIK